MAVLILSFLDRRNNYSVGVLCNECEFLQEISHLAEIRQTRKADRNEDWNKSYFIVIFIFPWNLTAGMLFFKDVLETAAGNSFFEKLINYKNHKLLPENSQL